MALASVLAPPSHPHTRLLPASGPELRTDWLDKTVASKTRLNHPGQSVDDDAVGCPYFNRCASAADDVRNRDDPPLQAASQGHTVACHRELDSLHT